VRRPVICGELLEEDEAFAVEQVIAEIAEEDGEFGKGKIGLVLFVSLPSLLSSYSTIPVKCP